jgi:outer membrane protein
MTFWFPDVTAMKFSFRFLFPFLAALGLAVPPLARAADAPAVPPAAVPNVPPANPAPALPPLTLADCIARALDKNFDLQIQGYTKQSARDAVVIADAAYDPTLTATAAADASRAAALGAVIPNSEANGQNASAAVGQKLANGAMVSAGTNLGRGGADNSFNPPYNGGLTLTVSQPLLQGNGVAVNRAAQDRARLGVRLANTNFKTTVLTVVRSVESAYYNLYFAREQLAVQQFALTTAELLEAENRDRRAIGVAIDLDVVSAEVGVANARLAVVTATQTVHNNEDTLLALISRFAFDTPIGPVQLGDEPVPEVSFAQSYALARANQPSLLAAQVTLDQLRLDVLTADDARQPDLNLGASVNLNSSEDSGFNAVDQELSGRGYNWQLGLNLTLPWGMRAQNARYRQALATFNSQQTTVEQLDQNLLTQVRTAVRAVETGKESVAIATLASKLAAEQFDQQKAQYDAGLATFRQVEDAQADLNTAQIAELQARVTLRQALADLAQLESTSLDRYKIKLEE